MTYLYLLSYECLKLWPFVCHLALHRLFWINYLCNYQVWISNLKFTVKTHLTLQTQHKVSACPKSWQRTEKSARKDTDRYSLPRQTQQAGARGLDYIPKHPVPPSLLLFHQSKIFNTCDLKILFLFKITVEKIFAMSVIHSGGFPHNKYLEKLRVSWEIC